MATRFRCACRNADSRGLTNPRVYHSADSNKSEIVVVFDTKDTKVAKEFASSADLKEAMIKAGVEDMPTIYFLNRLIEYPPLHCELPECEHLRASLDG